MANQTNKAKSRQHSAHAGKYTQQRYRTYQNTLRQIKRHMVKHPNDLQAVTALAKVPLDVGKKDKSTVMDAADKKGKK
jgi:hypothetical protein